MDDFITLSVTELSQSQKENIHAGIGFDNEELLKLILEATKRMDQSYKMIKRGLIDGWNECSCSS